MRRVDRRPNDDEDVVALVGESRLLAGLLSHALHRLRTERRGASLRRAREWVCSSDAGVRFSFEHACVTLGVEPRTVRRRLGLRAHVPRCVSRRGFTRGPRP